MRKRFLFENQCILGIQHPQNDLTMIHQTQQQGVFEGCLWYLWKIKK